MPQGLRNGKLPNSAFTASTFEKGSDPFKARIDNESKWCPHAPGKYYDYNTDYYPLDEYYGDDHGGCFLFIHIHYVCEMQYNKCFVHTI